MVDGTTSWTYSPDCWYKPISLNQYLGALLAQVPRYFLASWNRETPLTYLWFFTFSPMSPFQPGKRLEEQSVQKVQILKFRALSLPAAVLPMLSSSPCPLSSIYPFRFTSLHSNMQKNFTFWFVESAIIVQISAWFHWCLGWLDSYVAKLRDQLTWGPLLHHLPSTWNLFCNGPKSKLIQMVSPWNLSSPKKLKFVFKIKSALFRKVQTRDN